MNIRGIGIDVNDERVSGSSASLSRELDYFARCGFDVVELTTSGMFFIVNGDLNERALARITDVTKQFDFKYTLHLPDRLNLCSLKDADMSRRVFRSAIDFAAEVRAELVVYHKGTEKAAFSAESMKGSSGKVMEGLKESGKEEREALVELAGIAGKRGIRIGVENINPFPGEAYFAEKYPFFRENLKELHPGLFLEEVAGCVEQVRAMGAENIGVTLDAGHLFIATKITGEDYLSAIAKASGLVIHLHMNDNFGKNRVYGRLPFDRPIYGEGDLHLPPGWGRVPLKDLAERLGNYSGYIVLEIKPEYREYFSEALKWVRDNLY